MPAQRASRRSQRSPAPAPYVPPTRGRGRPKKTPATATATTPRSPKVKSVAVLIPPLPDKVAILEQKFDQLVGLVSDMARNNGRNRAIITQRSSDESLRDLSPSSDKVTLSGNATAGNLAQVVTSKSVLDRLGPKPDIVELPIPLPLPISRAVSYRDLPAVPEDIRLKLLDPSQPHITPLAELLPENRITNINGKVPELSLSGKGDSYIWKNVSQKKPFRNFADFSAAFSVFMAYRITVDPKLSVPLARYLEVVATIARLHPSSSKWMAYDELHRMYASLDVTNYALWTCRHNDSYNQMMLMPDQSDQADQPSGSSNKNHRLTCNFCDDYGHLGRDCPKKARRDHNHQLFRNGPATGGYFSQICRNYNSGYCSDPCPAGRDHKCFRCGKSHPSTDCNDEAAPRGDRRKKHST